MSENHNHSIHIQDELRSVAPLLARLPKDAPFRVPEGYFGSLPERTITRARMSATVPEGYFDALPRQVLARVREEKPKARIVPIWRNALRWAAAAVVVGMAVSIALWRPWQQPERGSESAFSEELALYFNRNIHHVDELLLIEAGLDTDVLDLDLYLDLHNNPDLYENWMLEIDLATIEDLSL
jgi:hypothetical protein